MISGRNNNLLLDLKKENNIPITSFSFLFSEMIQYMLNKSNDEKEFDLEEKLSSLGYIEEQINEAFEKQYNNLLDEKKKIEIKIASTKDSLKNIQTLNYEKDNQIVILNNNKNNILLNENQMKNKI